MLARAAGHAPARPEQVVVRGQVGRSPRDRLRPARAPAPREPQPQRDHRRLSQRSAGWSAALGMHEAVLDGEIVAFDFGPADPRPSFERLQRRMHVTAPNAVRRLMASTPVVYAIFDLLYLDGHSLMELPVYRAPRAARVARADRARVARPRRAPRRRRAAARGDREARGSRGSSPSASTPGTSPAGAAARG